MSGISLYRPQHESSNGVQKKNLPHTSQSEEAALFGWAERKNDEIFDCPIIVLFRTVHSLQIREGFINFQ